MNRNPHQADPSFSVRNAQGESVSLGRELGRGGEGIVYGLPAQPDLVGKLYHQPPDAPKQAKLRLMAESIDSPLRNYAAWPEETLHDDTGAVIGFTMQRIEQRLPIHMLYSPAQRRESFPQARFDFLVFVARNIAAAFETLHAHGHVLGDVNQGNVLVGEDSRVILIDCDSFQIQVGDALHRCEVGVAHFTPPELQSISTFEDITRTPNHDAFGLALLIFHLLMGGRHPYSGVPLSDKVGESLEADIRDYRYAYASDAARRLISPPPKSVPIASLPTDIVVFFERAFRESGVGARPSAQQWVAALDGMRQKLKACARQALHLHSGHLVDCPWCALDRRHVSYFGALIKQDAPLSVTAGSAKVAKPPLDIAAMEAAIRNMVIPAPLEMPKYPALRSPIGDDVIANEFFGFGLASGSGSALTVATLSAIALPAVSSGWLAGLAGVVVGAGVGAWRSSMLSRRFNAYRAELERLDRLKDCVADLTDELNRATGAGAIAEWHEAERDLRQFRAKEASALAQFKVDAVESGLRRFLQSKLIEQWRDPRLTIAERIRLRAAGIETAADFDKASLAKQQRLGDVARDALQSWKLQLVRDYRGSAPLQAQGMAQFVATQAKQRKALEQRLQAAFIAVQTAVKHGSLVVAARANQLKDLKVELAKQYARCLELARELPPVLPKISG